MSTSKHNSLLSNNDSYTIDKNIIDDMTCESEAYRASVERLTKEKSEIASMADKNIIEVPLPTEKIHEFEAFCRRVVGYKLDDFAPGACKRGTRRESKCRVLGPFTLTGKRVINTSSGEAFAIVECTDGRYISDSTKEDAVACVGKGEIQGVPQGSWKILVKKCLGQPDEKLSDQIKDHDDDFGRHAQIAASNMCHQIIAYIFEHLN